MINTLTISIYVDNYNNRKVTLLLPITIRYLWQYSLHIYNNFLFSLAQLWLSAPKCIPTAPVSCHYLHGIQLLSSLQPQSFNGWFSFKHFFWRSIFTHSAKPCPNPLLQLSHFIPSGFKNRPIFNHFSLLSDIHSYLLYICYYFNWY